METQNMWEFIEAIFILTTDRSVERVDRIRAHLKDIGMKQSEIVTFHASATGTTNDGADVSGNLLDIMSLRITDKVTNEIAKNHLSLVRKAYDAGHKNVLILEDDAVFTTPIPTEKITRIKEWLANHTYDIFYFGYCPWPIPISFIMAQDVVSIVSPYCAHAYLLSRSGMEKVLAYTKEHGTADIHYDKLLATIPNFAKFGAFPTLCFQEDGPALYKRAIHPLQIPFKYTSQSLEYLSVIIPMIIILAYHIIICNMP
jgi:hypothetical protein